VAGFEIGKDGLAAIVVGYDGSAPSRGALAFAAGVARRERATLHVCVVSVMPALTGAATQAAGPAAAALAEIFEELRADVTPVLRGLGVTHEVVRRNGDPARELEALADQVRADLLVVGRSRSRTHAVMGSVAVHLVRHAGRPVLVVP
jgi:nucleotide-binding universal stress UspA family protein